MVAPFIVVVSILFVITIIYVIIDGGIQLHRTECKQRLLKRSYHELEQLHKILNSDEEEHVDDK